MSQPRTPIHSEPDRALPETSDARELRRRAEQRMREQPPEAGRATKDADIQRFVHELQVHQIELEMQNEELRQARDNVEAGLEKYTELYDFAPVGYLTLRHDGSIFEANLTAARLLGIERSRLLQHRLGALAAPADLPSFNTFLQSVFERKVRAFCDLTFLHDGKSPIILRIDATVAPSGIECRAALIDITEHRRAEEHRLVLNKLESTGILAGGIAHDFNNLLTVILLDIERYRAIATAHVGAPLPLEEARQAALSARSLTQQLITFSKGGALVRKPACLTGVIQESVRLALSGSRVRGEFVLTEDLWPTEVDVGQIGQVLRNLVLNAREAMREGGVVTVRAENLVLGPGVHAALPPGDYVRVSIADGGSGIAPEVLPNIFDPYFSTKRRGSEKGMGLGLTICHTIIEKHGGAIRVDSELGKGTTVHFDLPASRKSPERQPPPKSAILAGQARILVMDDEEAMRKVLGSSLRRMGHLVELMEDGQAAIAAFEDAKRHGRPFDLVMLDLTVRAGLGGQEALQALLKVDPAVKAIVMTGYSNDPAVIEPERHGFKGVLTKPFESGALQAIITRLIRQ